MPPLSFAAVARWLARVDAWLARRARAARDREALAQTSEYELHDIGLSRGAIDHALSGPWAPDQPR